MLPSRLLTSLLKEAARANDRVVWAKAICRAATHQARSGRMSEAMASIAEVRRIFGPGLHPEVASWLMLSEGVVSWCKLDFETSYGRILRAHALANAFKTDDATAACAAWLAMHDWNTNHFERMAARLTQALSLSVEDDHATRCRVALSLVCAFMFAGDVEQAQLWFESGRRHAVAIGDEASLNAMLFNVAIFRLAKIRLDDAFNSGSRSERKRAQMEVSSAAALDLYLDSNLHPAWRYIMVGRQQLLDGMHSEALKSFAQASQTPGYETERNPTIEIDLSIANLAIGQRSEAFRLCTYALENIDEINDLDDKTYALASAAKIFLALGHDGLSTKLLDKANACLTEHRNQQRLLIDQLQSFRLAAEKKDPAEAGS